MVKVKELVKKAKIVLHGKKAKRAQKVIEKKLEEIEQSQAVTRKLKKQLKKLENMDISEFEANDYKYDDSDEDD